MDREGVEDFLLEFEEMKFNIFSRELKVPLSRDYIVSIYGPRRSGKTFFLYSLKDKNTLYVDFDDYRLQGVSFKEIREIIRIYIELFNREPKRILFDEIQSVEGWEFAVRSLNKLKKYEIVVTGSSSKLLSKEISTVLRGRTISYLLLPFSFREFLSVSGTKIKKAMTRDERAKLKAKLKIYLEKGGFPEMVLEKVPTKKWINEYIEEIVYKDFIERHNLKNISLAKFLVRFLIKDSPKEISAKSIYDKAKGTNIRVSKDTVYEYLDKVQDTAVFFLLERYSEKVHVRSSWPKKVYLCDNSLLFFLSKWDVSKAMENAVFLELLRMENDFPEIEVSYYKDSEKEVDFVVEMGDEKYLIQVTYEINEEDFEREVNNLVKVGKKLGTDKLFVITWDEGENIRVNNKEVVRIPLWKFLLEGNFLKKFSS